MKPSKLVDLIKNYETDQKIDILRNIIAEGPMNTLPRSFKAHAPFALAALLEKHSEVESVIEAIYREVNDIDVRPLCKECGAPVKFCGFGKGGYRQFCSLKCSNASELTKDKFRGTSVERYGTIHPNKHPNVKQKITKTNIERYGNRCSLHARDGFYERMILERKEEFRTQIVPQRLALSRQNGVIPLWDIDDYTGSLDMMPWKHEACGSIFQAPLGGGEGRLPSCPVCRRVRSRPQQELIECIQKFTNEPIEINTRKIIHPYEIDIFLPERGIGIEFNGRYWHLDGESTPLVLKTNLMEEKGLRLIHVWDFQWEHRREQVMGMIQSILQKNHKIYARECEVREISYMEAASFLERNHINGNATSSYRLGLFSGDDLVSVATFGKPRFNKKYEWELIRSATQIGTTVVGGFGKIIAEFQKTHSGSILSYVDHSLFNGASLEKVGFRMINKSKPNYFYWKNDTIVKRYGAQKHMLPKLLGDAYDDRLTEFDNMTLAGWLKCSDCGQLTFVKG